MRAVRRAVLAALVVALLALASVHVYRRLQPVPPVVVDASTDVPRLFAPPLGTRLHRIAFGNPVAPPGSRPKLIALTFDDGPYPVDTPLLVATLRDLAVHATFFAIGRDAEQNPGLLRLIAAGGNEIANHTESHPNLAELDDSAIVNELRLAAASLGTQVPDPAIRQLMRPPHGRYREATLAAIQHAGYTTVLWTDDPGDWREVGPAALVDHVTRNATAPEILLLHSGRTATVAALPAVVGRFRKAGYTFVTLGDLLHRVGTKELNLVSKMSVDR